MAADLLHEKNWYAIHLKCNHEAKAEKLLLGKGVETFFPTRSVLRRWKDRKKMVDFPLFPGYFFVRIPLIEKKKVLQTPSVVRIVGTPGPTPLPENQIFAIHTFLNEHIEFDPYPYLTPGIAVEVMRGPLKGVCGVLESKKGKHRLVVNIELINNSISTEIDAEDVQAV